MLPNIDDMDADAIVGVARTIMMEDKGRTACAGMNKGPQRSSVTNVRCGRCGYTGHGANNCYTRMTGTRGRKCYICGSEKHIAYDCDQRKDKPACNERRRGTVGENREGNE